MPTEDEQLFNDFQSFKAQQAVEPAGAIPQFNLNEPGLRPGAGFPQAIRRFGRGAVESFTGAERTARLPEEFRDAPEISEAVSNPFDLRMLSDSQRRNLAFGLITAVDPQAQIDIVREQIPSIKDEDINTNEQGITTFRIDGKPFLLNEPGLSDQDASQAIAQAALGIATAFPESMVAGLFARLAAGAIGGAGASILTDVAAESVGSQQGVSVPRALLSAAPGPLLTGGRRLVAGRVNRQVDELLGTQEANIADVAQSVARSQELEAATGIQQFRAARTRDPFAAEEQSLAGSVPAGGRIAQEQLEIQNAQAEAAVLRARENLGSAEDVLTAPAQLRDAAIARRTQLDDARTAAARPHYEEAFAEAGDVDVSPVLNTVDQIINKRFASGAARGRFENIKDMIRGAGEGTTGEDVLSNLEPLHGAKVQLDDLIDAAKRGENRSEVAAMTEIKRSLLAQMESNRVPGGSAYKAGREAFAEASAPINVFDQTTGGQIARMQDAQLSKVRRATFESVERMEQMKALSFEIDPSGKQWGAMLRDQVSERLKRIQPKVSDIAAPEAARLPRNVPANLSNAIFGNAEERRIIIKALPTEDARKNWFALEEALNLAAIGRPGGSQTAIRELVAKKHRKKGIVQGLTKFMSAPIRSIAEAGSDVAFDANMRALAELAYNPRWLPEMTKIRKLSTKPTDQARAVVQILNRIVTLAAQDQPEETVPRTNGTISF